MLITIKNLDRRETNNEDARNIFGKFEHLDVHYDKKSGILWKYIREDADPHFSHRVLDDIRSVQNQVRHRTIANVRADDRSPIKYVVFASKIPGVFNLGGDLRLFRELIGQGDRSGLKLYSKKATDAVFYHSSNYGDAVSFSLVQGRAMGGGFEAALAGNVLVAEKGTKLGFPEVLFGLFPGMGAYTMLRRRVDARVAEEIILAGRNYSAEALHELGVIDVLCEPGEGEEVIRSYASRLSTRPGVAAFRRALNHSYAVDRKELYSLADAWVDAALNLGPAELRRIDRLIANQDRSYQPGATPPVKLKAVATV